MNWLVPDLEEDVTCSKCGTTVNMPIVKALDSGWYRFSNRKEFFSLICPICFKELSGTDYASRHISSYE